MFNAGSEPWLIEGGVREPLDGVVSWLPAPSLDPSLERSVRKLARERRRRLERKDGAIVARDWVFVLEC